jgi:uncharacterized low-complexity protein
MKTLNLKKIAITSTLLTGASLIALDLTPDSWQAQAMSKNSSDVQEKGSQGACAEGKCAAGKCAAGKCAGNLKKDEKPVSATETDKKDSKGKGSEHGCGEGKCG